MDMLIWVSHDTHVILYVSSVTVHLTDIITCIQAIKIDFCFVVKSNMKKWQLRGILLQCMKRILESIQ